MVVLDTCAVIELCKSEPAFSAKTSEKIDKGAFILGISFAEIACKVKLGKLIMQLPVRELYQEFVETENITIINVDMDEWFDSIELDWPGNKDPADRMLTAFAIKRKLPLVSCDGKIKKFYKKVIW